MTAPTAPRAWRALLTTPLTTDAALRAAGEALTCDDAQRYAAVLGRCGPTRTPAVLVWHAHLATCAKEHGTLDVPPVEPSMLAADALLRAVHQPALLAAMVGVWTCSQVLDAATAAHILNGRSFVSRDLVLSHVAAGCDRHGKVVTLLDALGVILDHLERMDAP